MATTSEVKAGLDAIADSISGAIAIRASSKSRILAARNQLAGLPSTYSDVIATINGYAPTGAFEQVADDELSKLTTEFLALKAALETELDDLGVSYP